MIKLSKEKVLVKDFTEAVASAESSIIQQANEIASKVSSTDYNGNTIASMINQTSTTVKIKAQSIELEGIVTANNNFKVLLDGSIQAVNATLSGSITATKMTAPNENFLYGEVGRSGQFVGLGLYDTRYRAEPYFNVVELLDGKGFGLRDHRGTQRFSAGVESTNIRDYNANGRIELREKTTIFRDQYQTSRFEIANTYTNIYSPDRNSYITIQNNVVGIYVKGVLKASW